MAVDVLLEDTQAVAQHDNLVEEGFDGHLFGFQSILSGSQYHGAPLPLVSQGDGIWRLHVLVKDVLDGGYDILEIDAA